MNEQRTADQKLEDLKNALDHPQCIGMEELEKRTQRTPVVGTPPLMKSACPYYPFTVPAFQT